MALILLCSKRLATFWDTEKDRAMLHQNSVFHGLLKHVPWHRFDSLVEDHEADARVRRLSTKSQLVALLYGQLSGAASLREIVTGLSSHAGRPYRRGAERGRRGRSAKERCGAERRGALSELGGASGAGAGARARVGSRGILAGFYPPSVRTYTRWGYATVGA